MGKNEKAMGLVRTVVLVCVLLSTLIVLVYWCMIFYDCYQCFRYGSFQLFPEFNLGFLKKISGSSENLDKAIEYAYYVIDNNSVQKELVRGLSSVSMLLSVVFMIIWKPLFSKLHISKRVKQTVMISGCLSIVMIVTFRLFVRNSYGYIYLPELYPFAYLDYWLR